MFLEGIVPAFNVIMCFVSKENYLSVLVLARLIYRYIIGKKGETRKRLEFDTKTSISIPKQGLEGQIGENREHHHKGGGEWKCKLTASSAPSSCVWQLSRLPISLQSRLQSHGLRSWWKVFGKSSHSHTSCHSPWTIPRFKRDSWDLKKMCCSSVHRYRRKEKHKWPCFVTT